MAGTVFSSHQKAQQRTDVGDELAVIRALSCLIAVTMFLLWAGFKLVQTGWLPHP